MDLKTPAVTANCSLDCWLLMGNIAMICHDDEVLVVQLGSTGAPWPLQAPMALITPEPKEEPTRP